MMAFKLSPEVTAELRKYGPLAAVGAVALYLGVAHSKGSLLAPTAAPGIGNPFAAPIDPNANSNNAGGTVFTSGGDTTGIGLTPAVSQPPAGRTPVTARPWVPAVLFTDVSGYTYPSGSIPDPTNAAGLPHATTATLNQVSPVDSCLARYPCSVCRKIHVGLNC